MASRAVARSVDVPADIVAAVNQKFVAGIGHLGGSAIVQVQEERARW